MLLKKKSCYNLNNKKEKKNIRKVLKKIKYENIFTLIGIVFDFICIYKHIQLNGFYANLGIEFIVYISFTLLFRYIIKDIRKNPKEYTSIFFE